MFNELTINYNKNNLGVGQIAESLLYYQKVNLICSISLFPKLEVLGELDAFKELMKRDNLNVIIEGNHIAMGYKSDPDWVELHLVSSASIDVHGRLVRILEEQTGKLGKSRRIARSILDNSKLHNYDSKILQDIHNDLNDEQYMREVVRKSVMFFNPNYNLDMETLEISLQRNDNMLKFDTNLDFKAINKGVEGGQFDLTSIIFNVMNSWLNNTFAGEYKSDISTDPIMAILLESKINDLITRSTKSKNQISCFSEHVLNGYSVQETIDAGNRSLKEFIPVLDRAEKFKVWLAQVDDDKSLINQYIQDISKESWVENAQVKSLRWLFFEGLSAVMGAPGVGTVVNQLTDLTLSAGNEFLLSNLLEKWKPNTFVNGDLNRFMRK